MRSMTDELMSGLRTEDRGTRTLDGSDVYVQSYDVMHSRRPTISAKQEKS
jgi:hypothetical protein